MLATWIDRCPAILAPTAWSAISQDFTSFAWGVISSTKTAILEPHNVGLARAWQRAADILNYTYPLDHADGERSTTWVSDDLVQQLAADIKAVPALVVPILRSLERREPEAPAVYQKKVRDRIGLVYQLARFDDRAMQLASVAVVEPGMFNWSQDLRPMVAKALESQNGFKPVGDLAPAPLVTSGLNMMNAAALRADRPLLDDQPIFETETCPARTKLDDGSAGPIRLAVDWLVEVAAVFRWQPAFELGRFEVDPPTRSKPSFTAGF